MSTPTPDDSSRPSWLSRVALGFVDRAEHWFPDAFVFALIASVIVFLAGLLVAQSPGAMVGYWGKDFWTLLTFGMQMVLIIVTGFVLATSPPVTKAIDWLTTVPKNERAAITWCALFGLLTSWLNWGFSLIFGAMLARALARRFPRVDYRALAFSAYVAAGLGIEQNGLSSSADLLVATKGSMPPALVSISGGLIPISKTIFLPQTLWIVLIEIVVVTAVIWLWAPSPERSLSAADLGVDLSVAPTAKTSKSESGPRSIGSILDDTPVLTVFITLIAAVFLWQSLSTGGGLAAINLNTVNMIFLFAGILLHWRPRSLVKAVQDAVPATHGVILQFPFYAGIFGMIALSPLAEKITHFFVSISTTVTYPGIVAIYSAILGLFVPSAGSKFFLEAPYIMAAAHQLKVNLGWVIVSYGMGEAASNLIQPFWMLPVLGILGLKARHVIGFGMTLFCLVLPLTVIMLIVFGLFVHS